MSRLTPAEQLAALGQLHARDMTHEDMADASMYRRRLKQPDGEPLSEKEAERVDSIFRKHFK
jgi:hypothetical protein